jgi:hypothetical protein
LLAELHVSGLKDPQPVRVRLKPDRRQNADRRRIPHHGRRLTDTSTESATGQPAHAVDNNEPADRSAQEKN